jgi:hypothetical protein
MQKTTLRRLGECSGNLRWNVIYHIADAIHGASGQEDRRLDAEVVKKDQTQPAGEASPQLARFLQEPEKDGHFTDLRVRPNADADTATGGPQAGKDVEAV